MLFKNAYVECTADIDTDLEIVKLNGRILLMEDMQAAEIFAANPIDRMISYSGSGLPFPCAMIAFDLTPNYHQVRDPSGAFTIQFRYPNSYYTEDQMQRVMPSIFFRMHPRASAHAVEPILVRFELPNPEMLNVRTINYRAKSRLGPQSYSAKEDVIPICGAEETMRRYRDIKIQKDLV
jgi:hypothetical protein